MSSPPRPLDVEDARYGVSITPFGPADSTQTGAGAASERGPAFTRYRFPQGSGSGAGAANGRDAAIRPAVHSLPSNGSGTLPSPPRRSADRFPGKPELADADLNRSASAVTSCRARSILDRLISVATPGGTTRASTQITQRAKTSDTPLTPRRPARAGVGVSFVRHDGHRPPVKKLTDTPALHDQWTVVSTAASGAKRSPRRRRPAICSVPPVTTMRYSPTRTTSGTATGGHTKLRMLRRPSVGTNEAGSACRQRSDRG